MDYRRIVVIGNGGAGKSTFSVKLGEALQIPVVHLDKLWWKPGWTNRSADEFDSLLSAELQKDAWIMDGNFRRTFQQRLYRAELCVVLDIDTRLCLQSAYARAAEFAGRVRPDMGEGCEEVVRPDFLKWISSYREKVLPGMMSVLRESGVPYIVFGDRCAADSWIGGLK